jgi:hypothetical protein
MRKTSSSDRVNALKRKAKVAKISETQRHGILEHSDRLARCKPCAGMHQEGAEAGQAMLDRATTPLTRKLIERALEGDSTALRLRIDAAFPRAGIEQLL